MKNIIESVLVGAGLALGLIYFFTMPTGEAVGFGAIMGYIKLNN